MTGLFLSTPSARRATSTDLSSAHNQLWISIHALREEGDSCAACGRISSVKISIHALREEGDWIACAMPEPEVLFLSTPSARRATFLRSGLFPYSIAISIHALREEGDHRPYSQYLQQNISIHALREEGDMTVEVDDPDIFEFLSTPSARRATDRCRNARAGYKISIHALREEGDPCSYARSSGCC